jgi:hypothetical protein
MSPKQDRTREAREASLLSVAALEYEVLARHVGHQIACVEYGGGRNVAIECEDCCEVISDIDRIPATASHSGKPVPSVWVCTFEHRDGLDVWVCASEELAYGELAEVCREFWEEAREVDRDRLLAEDERQLPPAPPEDDRGAVEEYFAAMIHGSSPESFLIAAHEVIGASGGRR